VSSLGGLLFLGLCFGCLSLSSSRFRLVFSSCLLLGLLLLHGVLHDELLVFSLLLLNVLVLEDVESGSSRGVLKSLHKIVVALLHLSLLSSLLFLLIGHR